MNAQMVDSEFLANPGRKFRIKDCPTDSRGKFKDKEQAEAETEKLRARLAEMQELLYAESKHALLIVFQAMDAGGKDGAIEHVFHGVNPQGCSVHSFKAPSTLERSRDFLWRHHLAMPAKGMIGIHNRSHYEAVLIERVRNIAPPNVWKNRYEQIKAFEDMLAAEGTTILKFFLHISKDEQKQRLQSRLDEPHKRWKFNPGDLEERKIWDEYMAAFDDAIEKTTTEKAPWYVVPSDRKWFRNWVISDVIVRTLESLKMDWPKPAAGIEGIVIE
jgi:PPK2 family polyphosphate:nucleotide phosphotransferase